MVLVLNIFRHATPHRVDRVFRPGQLLSSALLSLAHGSNDAQKTMGIIVGLLASSQAQAVFSGQTGWLRYFYVADAKVVPPLWVEVMAYLAISLGTLFGGWRIVHTMGSRITRLRPVGGFAAETGGGIIILIASQLGIPVSTTHTITGSIVGVGATNRLSAVRWGLAGRIVWAWILTIPASALMAALSFWLLSKLYPV
jgi:PiT family inorganic phosphate transporter